MDSIAVELGGTFCGIVGLLAAAKTQCIDYGSMRGIGYGLIGTAIFAAAFITMGRTHPVGRA
jgi:hypothetical protein